MQKHLIRVQKYINDPSLMTDLHWTNPNGSTELMSQQQIDSQSNVSNTNII